MSEIDRLREALVSIAEVAAELRRAGVLTDDPVFADEHLDAIIVHRDSRLLEALRRQVLAPLEGLAPIIVEELTAAIRRMTADEGTAFILVEQHAEVALSLTDTAIVLERGAIVHRARSQDLLKDHATLDRLIGLQISGQ